MCPIPTEPCGGAKLKNPDETGAYQGLGTPSALGSADHELTAELLYGFQPPRNCSMEDDLHGSSKPPLLRTSRALWEIGWNTSSLWLTRLGLT